MRKIKVMVVDDHAMISKGVKSSLDKNPYYRVVAEASDGLEAINLAKKHRPEMVIMDINMPRVNGIEATRELKDLFPDIKILIYTMHSDTAYISRVMTAGAAGYVLKNDATEDLILALNSIYNGGIYFSKIASDILKQEKNEASLILDFGGDLSNLSRREREVMKLLAEGLTPKEISQKLNIAPSTVQTHKYNLMTKLNVSRMADLYKIAVKHNLVKI